MSKKILPYFMIASAYMSGLKVSKPTPKPKKQLTTEEELWRKAKLDTLLLKKAKEKERDEGGKELKAIETLQKELVRLQRRLRSSDEEDIKELIWGIEILKMNKEVNIDEYKPAGGTGSLFLEKNKRRS